MLAKVVAVVGYENDDGISPQFQPVQRLKQLADLFVHETDAGIIPGDRLLEESTRVPLLISAPGFDASAGQSSAGIVELIDLYPTIADLCGLKRKAPANLQGTSLRPLLENPSRHDWGKKHAYTVTHQGGESVRTEHWRYNRWGTSGEKGEELYDLKNDPNEWTNLAGSQLHARALQEMRTVMEDARMRSLGE